MFKVRKKTGKAVKAYQLGVQNPVIEKLISDNKIIVREDHTFEVMSQEAIHGETGHGQIAKAGDYVKIDSAGNPYPVDENWFEENHKHISNEDYEQIPQPLDAWTVQEPMCKEVDFLIREKGLVLDPDHPSHFFSAPLWGTLEVADRDSVLIFYSISYTEDGTAVTDADFNFVVQDEFQKSYDRL